jgi:signal transduction histidine kinase
MKHATNELTQIERENARLRGDLLTLAKRFSHDLRTPLGGLVSTAEAMKEILADSNPADVVLVDSLLNSAEEMTQLIKQVSFVARASANPLPKVAVHMAEPVFVARQRLESRILKCDASVKEPAKWPVVTGVAVWLEAIWWHLIRNSLRFGGEHCHIELGWTAHGDNIRFWLRDNGPGVAEPLRAKLFKEFHFLHAEQSVPGMGLSIVQRLVELQGGTTGYESPAGGGALFYFTLPTSESADPVR